MEIHVTTGQKSNIYQLVACNFFCNCTVCYSQARDKINLNRENFQLKTDYSSIGEKKRFTWLLCELGKHSLTQDVAIPTPDLVVFNKSRPCFLLQSTKDTIKYITSIEKLGLTDILKNYTKIVRARKKEEKPGVKPVDPHRKEIGLLRYTVKNKENDNLDETPEIEEGPLRVLGEKEFFDLMYERAGSAAWRNVVYIQTVVRCRTGIADEIITVEYMTPLDKNLEDLKKSFNTTNDESLMGTDPQQYCELLCKRIDAFMHYNSNLEVVHMKAEFSVDDFGKIWLTYVMELYVNKIVMPQKLSNKQGELTKKEIEAMNAELDKRIIECQGKAKFEEYNVIMTGIFNNAKQKADIHRVLTAKPISYMNADLIRKLQTQHMPSIKATEIEKKDFSRPSSFDSRNITRTRQRIEFVKSYSKGNEFFPTSYIQRKEWIFTPTGRSPELVPRNKSSFSMRK